MKVGLGDELRIGLRLGLEDIERGAGNVAGAQLVDQRLLVDQAAAGAVDNPGAWLHELERRTIDEVLGFSAERHVHGQKIHARQQIFEINQLETEIGGDLLRHVRVGDNDFHLHRLSAARHLATDATEADDADRLVLELDAEVRRAVPLATANGRRGRRYVPGAAKQERHRMLGSGDRVAPGQVHHQHPGGRCRFHIDVVDADAGATDDAQVLPGGDRRRIHELLRVDDDAVIRGDDIGQRAGLAVGLVVDVAPRVLEDGQSPALEGAAH